MSTIGKLLWLLKLYFIVIAALFFSLIESAYAGHIENGKKPGCPGGDCSDSEGCVSWTTYKRSNCCYANICNGTTQRCCGYMACCWVNPPPACGDGSCNGGESCGSCQADCGACPPPPVPQCGTNGCESGENCSNCPQDCGSCDTTPPVFSGISNQSLYVDSFCQPINYSKPASISASDNVDGDLSYSASSGARLYWSVPNLPMNFPLGITNINWYARDSFGNQSTVLQKWTLIDNIKPLLSNVSNSYTIQANEIPTNYTGTTFIISANAGDNCDTTPSVTINPNTTKFAVGNYSLTVSACDDSSNCQTQIVSLTIEDTLGPNVNFFGNMAIEQSALSGSSVTINPTIQDNSDKAPVYEVHYNSTSGVRLSVYEAAGIKTSDFNLGLHQLYWMSKDKYNNINTQIQTIIIQDTTKPIINSWIDTDIYQANSPMPFGSVTSQNELDTQHALMLLKATEASKNRIISETYPLIIPYPEASDNCDISLTITNNAPLTYQLGLTRVTWNVVDDTGNTTIVNHDVMVIDTTKPVFLEADENQKLPTLTYVPDENFNPLDSNACFTPAFPMPALYDNGYAVEDLIVNMKNTPNCYNPPAPSDTTKDANIYTITWEVIDPIGNKETATQDIRVKRQYIIIAGFANGIGTFVPGGYTNQPVTLHIEISATNGINESISGNRIITVTPTPDFQSQIDAYTEEAIYSKDQIVNDISIFAHDTGSLSNEDNWGYKYINVSFGIDTTKPKIEFELNDTTYYFGEDLLISHVLFSDKEGSVISGIGSYTINITGNSITHILVDEVEELYGKPKGGKERVTNISCSSNDISEILCYDDTRFILKSDYTEQEDNAAIISYGKVGDIPLFGKWESGVSSNIGIYRPKEKTFYLVTNLNPLTEKIISYGEYGDIPLVGDYDGDGTDTIGVYRSGIFLLKNSNQEGSFDMNFAYGQARDKAFTGDFNADNKDGVGIYRDNTFYLKDHLDETPADNIVSLGIESNDPFIHDSNNDQIDTVGVKIYDTFYLKESNNTGVPENSHSILRPYDIVLIGDHQNNDKELPIIFRPEVFINVKELSEQENNYRGEHIFTIHVTDSAGNTQSRSQSFHVFNYIDALIETIAFIDNRLQEQSLTYEEEEELKTGRDGFKVALEYARIYYMGGSYLRAEQGIIKLKNITVNSDIYFLHIKNITRAMWGDISVLQKELADSLADDEIELFERSKIKMEKNKENIFHNNVLLSIQESRFSYDDLALLALKFDQIKAKKDSADNNAENFSKITDAISAIKPILIDISDEIEKVLSISDTRNRKELEQVQNNLLDVRTLCLNDLQGFLLNDYDFMSCYLEINQIAENLDIVAESLLYSYYWKTALSLSLFTLLDVSLYLSPTSLQKISDQHGYLEPTNPNYDAELALAYQKYHEAVIALNNGNIHSAINVYIDSKCMMISLYNKYYSLRRTFPNIADPPDPILLPIDYGCN